MNNNVNLIGNDNIPEIVIDYSKNPNGELIVHLNYNEQLSKERKKSEKYLKPYSENILILYIDSVSRANAMRQLKKTTKFFEQFMSYDAGLNQKYISEKFHSFQFFKYHSFLGHTSNNYPKLFYGDNSGKNIMRFTKYFKENGYVTCLTNDYCQKDAIRTYHNMRESEICDHEFIICDPTMTHLLHLTKRCLYNKISIEYQLDYGDQFWRKYNVNRKLLIILDEGGHEPTLEVLKYQDDIMYDFLNNLYKDHLLKETSVLLLSDHGTIVPSIYYFLEFYQIESNLPMFFILINDRENQTYEKQYKYIYQNQQTFITAYDIFNTICHLLYGDLYDSLPFKEKDSYDFPKTRKGKSLLMEIEQKSRFPSIYKDMEKKICVQSKY